MSITVEEAANSREWTRSGSCILRFVVRGTANDYLALQALRQNLPAWVSDVEGRHLTPQDERPSLVAVYVDADHDDGVWTSEVEYRLPSEHDRPPEPEVGSVGITVSTVGGVARVRTSLETLGRYSALRGVEAPDYDGAVNVTDRGVEGVEVVAPTFRLVVEKVFSPDDPPDLDAVYRLTGRVNDARFAVQDTSTGMSLVFDAGELLFRGATVSRPRGDGGIPVSFEFEASPNTTDVVVGRIRVPRKDGWDYLWVRFRQEVVSGSLVEVPAFAYVERVYERGDFSRLKI